MPATPSDSIQRNTSHAQIHPGRLGTVQPVRGRHVGGLWRLSACHGDGRNAENGDSSAAAGLPLTETIRGQYANHAASFLASKGIFPPCPCHLAHQHGLSATAASYRLQVIGDDGHELVGSEADFKILESAYALIPSPLTFARVTVRPQPSVSSWFTAALRDEGYSGIGANSYVNYRVTVNAPAGLVVPVNFESRLDIGASGQNGSFYQAAASVDLSMTSQDASLTFSAGIRNAFGQLDGWIDEYGAKYGNTGWIYDMSTGGSPGHDTHYLSEELPVIQNWQTDGSIREVSFHTGQPFSVAFEGNIGGVFMTASSFDVGINASVYLIGAGGSLNSFIDPYFYISPDFLASHPDVSLVVETGFGNMPSLPVPEPGSLALFMAGLAVMVIGGRRK